MLYQKKLVALFFAVIVSFVSLFFVNYKAQTNTPALPSMPYFHKFLKDTHHQIRITAMQKDSFGAMYIAGMISDNFYQDGFPIGGEIPGYDTTYNGEGDGFMLKIDPMGENILFSTFIGGSELDRVWDIAVNDEGLVYLTGMTISGPEDGFPIGNGIPGYQQDHKGGSSIFLIILSSTGTDILYSSYFGGGSIINDGLALALDHEGNIFIGGNTTSSPDDGFPIGGGIPGYDSTLNCDPSLWPGDPPTDAFVMKLDPTGMNILYSTYLGGEGYNYVNRLMIDDHGNAHVSGRLGRLSLYGSMMGDLYINSHNIWSHNYNKEENTEYLILNPDGTDIIYSALPPFETIVLPIKQGLLMAGSFVSESQNVKSLFFPSDEHSIRYSPFQPVKDDRQIFIALLDIKNQRMVHYKTFDGNLLVLDQVATDSDDNIYLLGSAGDASLLKWDSYYFPVSSDYHEEKKGICFLIKLDSKLEKILYACHFDSTNRKRFPYNFNLFLAVDKHEQAHIVGSIPEIFNEYSFVMKVDTTIDARASEKTNQNPVMEDAQETIPSSPQVLFWMVFLILLLLLVLGWIRVRYKGKKSR